VVSLLVSLLVGLGLFGLRLAGGFEALELAAYDWFLRLRPEAPADPRIVLITVTEQDIHQYRWPLPDATLARALDLLADYQPRAIGLDIYRDIPVEPGHAEFETTLRNHANIIAVTKVGALESLVPPPQVLQETERVGFNDIIVDPGGTVRRGLLFLDESNTTFYSLALRLALLYLQVEDIGLQPDATHPEHLRLGRTTVRPFEANDGGYIRADAAGYQFLLDFSSGYQEFLTFSLGQLLAGEIAPVALRDKVVLIGTTATSVKDDFYTPYSRGRQVEQQVPGVVLHAQMVSQLLRSALEGHATITTASDPEEALWLLLWSVLGAMLGVWVRSLWRLAVCAVGGLLFLGFVGYSALSHGWWIPVVPPVLAWVLSAALAITYVSYHERTQRSVLMHLFSQHVSPEVAETIWQHREDFVAGGHPRPQTLTATILFTDLEGSTSLEERLNERDLVDWVNTFLGEMAPHVMQHQGMINKYVGDAIMALFGVPVPHTTPEAIGQDAVRAVQCALAMRQTLITLNRRWQAQQLPTIKMRIGIYTGPVVAGVVGSSERLEYTVLGDTVNIASRLEGYQKESFTSETNADPCRILIGDTTMQYVGQQFETQCVGEVHLKGKEKTTTIYRIFGPNRTSTVVEEDKV
jgi:adenylate cyclase